MAGDHIAKELVLVTGGSGFVGAHCIIQLLKSGYRVRTTLRSMGKENDLRAMVKEGGVEPGAALSVVLADLLSDAGWPEAVHGCQYVLHVASPFPPGIPKDEDELIIPARDGALRVLRAARDADVRRVVMTSSFAAIGYGHPPQQQAFVEDNWTDLQGDGLSPYIKSKTIAEREAWEFMAREGGALELAVINPVGIFGPILGTDYAASVQLLHALMTGTMSAIPQIATSVVDVRDVADLHLRAMVHPEARGERFLAVAGVPITFPQIAELLRNRMPEIADRVPTRVLPTWLAHLLAVVKPSLRPTLPQLGKIRRSSSAKARHMLDWSPRSTEEAILATAGSLVKFDLV